MQLKVHH